jgi:hypothetical protein
MWLWRSYLAHSQLATQVCLHTLQTVWWTVSIAQVLTYGPTLPLVYNYYEEQCCTCVFNYTPLCCMDHAVSIVNYVPVSKLCQHTCPHTHTHTSIATTCNQYPKKAPSFTVHEYLQVSQLKFPPPWSPQGTNAYVGGAQSSSYHCRLQHS